jgi:hypothetical protein
MPPRDEKMRARDRLNAEAPLSSALEPIPLEEQAAELIREAKRNDVFKASHELASSVVDALMRDYVRYALRKKRSVRSRNADRS